MSSFYGYSLQVDQLDKLSFGNEFGRNKGGIFDLINASNLGQPTYVYEEDFSSPPKYYGDVTYTTALNIAPSSISNNNKASDYYTRYCFIKQNSYNSSSGGFIISDENTALLTIGLCQADDSEKFPEYFSYFFRIGILDTVTNSIEFYESNNDSDIIKLFFEESILDTNSKVYFSANNTLFNMNISDFLKSRKNGNFNYGGYIKRQELIDNFNCSDDDLNSNNKLNAHFFFKINSNISKITRYKIIITLAQAAYSAPITYSDTILPEPVDLEIGPNERLGTSNILDGAITEDKLAIDAVTTTKIANSSVTSDKLAINSVVTAKIADYSITEYKLATDSVTTTKIKNNAITSSKIANSAITASHIAPDNIGSSHISNGSISTNHLSNLSISTNKLQDNSVTTDKINNYSITSDKLATDSVTTTKILNGNITNAKLANNSVTETKIQDSAVSTNKIANEAVTGAKIANLTITSNNLAANSVNSDKIADSSILRRHIASSVINSDKCNDSIAKCEGDIYFTDTAIYDSTKTIEGYYTLVGGFCFLTAFVSLRNDWNYLEFRLPVASISYTAVIAHDNNQRFFITTDNGVNSHLYVRNLDNANLNSNDGVGFTIIYKYKNLTNFS